MLEVHHGCVNLSAIVTLNAAVPITDELMENALNILYEQVFRNNLGMSYYSDIKALECVTSLCVPTLICSSFNGVVELGVWVHIQFIEILSM